MKNLLFLILATAVLKIDVNAQINTSDSIPVRVGYFNYSQNNINTIRLNWKVVCSLSYANFQVQRSTNGIDYKTINSFTADRIRCQSPFDFDDASLATRTYYRLKVGDRDGNFSTSKIIVVFGKEKSFEINSITPSLITNTALVSISSADNDKAIIQIINMQGNTVKKLETNLSKGVTEFTLDLADLSKGIYFVRLTNSFAAFRLKRIAKL